MELVTWEDSHRKPQYLWGGGAVGGAEMKLTVREARSNCFERLFALSTLNGIAFAYFHSKHTTEVFELLFYR